MNTEVFLWLYGFAGRWVIFDWIVAFCADALGYLLVAALLIGVVVDRRRVYPVLQVLSVAAIARVLGAGAIHAVLHISRPFTVFTDVTPLVPTTGWSFPSGHATFFFGLAAALWIWNRMWGIVGFCVAIVMGVARVIAGAHWPADILGGAVVGIATAMLVNFVVRKNQPRAGWIRGT